MSFDVVAIRPFVPAKDVQQSFVFYVDLGFNARRLDDELAVMEMGGFSFFVQKFYVEEHAHNFMMQLMVKDLDAWWERIQSLDLSRKYGVKEAMAPKVQPWGLRVAYVFDPAGVLWHVVQAPEGM
jgi:uncharacterized glyoxalase superfamily protein PhnB